MKNERKLEDLFNSDEDVSDGEEFDQFRGFAEISACYSKKRRHAGSFLVKSTAKNKHDNLQKAAVPNTRHAAAKKHKRMNSELEPVAYRRTSSLVNSYPKPSKYPSATGLEGLYESIKSTSNGMISVVLPDTRWKQELDPSLLAESSHQKTYGARKRRISDCFQKSKCSLR